MPKPQTAPTIDEYLRQRLMPVEGAIPHIQGIEMFGASVPAGTVGGDLFEYINFQQRYDIDARIERAKQLAVEFLEPLPPGAPVRNSVDDHIEWLRKRSDFRPIMETEYRFAKSSEQLRVADDLRELYSTAGVLIVDAQGHGIISAKIASTVHDTFHALMLSELDRYGKTTPQLFENLNLRLAQSVFARNELGELEGVRENATMLYGELHPGGSFRFANFGHPPPLVFSAKCSRLLPLHEDHMAQFLSLGLQLPADHPDRQRYFSMNLRKREIQTEDISEINLMHPGDILLLYTDGVYDGSDILGRKRLETILQKHHEETPREICDALMEYALEQDDLLREAGDEALIDDKTVFVVKRT
ncbi:MAG: PP2C family protein-serine/threonine phosphatase [Acidobacteriaceae bacterium]